MRRVVGVGVVVHPSPLSYRYTAHKSTQDVLLRPYSSGWCDHPRTIQGVHEIGQATDRRANLCIGFDIRQHRLRPRHQAWTSYVTSGHEHVVDLTGSWDQCAVSDSDEP
jgi:hypothetical protein